MLRILYQTNDIYIREGKFMKNIFELPRAMCLQLENTTHLRDLLPYLRHGVVSTCFHSPQVGDDRIDSHLSSVVPVLFRPCSNEWVTNQVIPSRKSLIEYVIPMISETAKNTQVV